MISVNAIAPKGMTLNRVDGSKRTDVSRAEHKS